MQRHNVIFRYSRSANRGSGRNPSEWHNRRASFLSGGISVLNLVVICATIVYFDLKAVAGELPANVLESLKENASNLNPNQIEWIVERTHRMPTNRLAKLLDS